MDTTAAAAPLADPRRGRLIAYLLALAVFIPVSGWVADGSRVSGHRVAEAAR